MPNDEKESGVVGQIIVAVVVALLVGGTAPWWWTELKTFLSTNDNQTPTPTPKLREDCLAFDSSNVRLQSDGARWLLTDGRSRMILFDKGCAKKYYSSPQGFKKKNS